MPGRELDEKTKQDVDAIWLPLGQAITRVQLLFGEESPTGQAARNFSKLSSHLLADAALVPETIPGDSDKAGNNLEAADEAFDKLLRVAHEAIQPSGWTR